MPTYDYKCNNGHVFEEFHGINEDVDITCPTCGEDAERIIIAAPGIVFKGGGVTRSKSYEEGEKKEKSTAKRKYIEDKVVDDPDPNWGYD